MNIHLFFGHIVGKTNILSINSQDQQGHLCHVASILKVGGWGRLIQKSLTKKKKGERGVVYLLLITSIFSFAFQFFLHTPKKGEAQLLDNSILTM